MNIVSFVPIKLNSVRLKNKNILPLNGKPLCWHVLKTLLLAMEHVYIYASTEKVMDYAPSGVKFIKRPVELDSDKTLGLEIYSSFVKCVPCEFYCLAHVTSPFLSVETINKGIDALSQGHDSAFTARKEQTFAWYCGKPINYHLDHVPRTQDISPVYIETSGYYMFSRSVIESGRRIGNNPAIIEVNAVEGLDIDTSSDYELALLVSGK
jgi:CMP-N-acetylneuraminic acid synthetase